MSVRGFNMFEWFRKWILRGVVLHEDDRTVIRQEDFATLNYIKAQIQTLGRYNGGLHKRLAECEDTVNRMYDHYRKQIIALDNKIDNGLKKKIVAKKKPKRRKR